MIRGVVNARHEAVLPLRVRGPAGAELDVDAVIDTGFTASLTLPPATISTLGLTRQGARQVVLGDGTVRSFDTYDAEVEWDGNWQTILVTEIDGASLLGLGMLVGHEVFIEFVPGGVVDVTAIP
jgi:clan AA aspartic protease